MTSWSRWTARGSLIEISRKRSKHATRWPRAEPTSGERLAVRGRSRRSRRRAPSSGCSAALTRRHRNGAGRNCRDPDRLGCAEDPHPHAPAGGRERALTAGPPGRSPTAAATCGLRPAATRDPRARAHSTLNVLVVASASACSRPPRGRARRRLGAVGAMRANAADELLLTFVEDPALAQVIESALAEFDRHQPEIWSDDELRELGARAIAAAMSQFASVVTAASARSAHASDRERRARDCAGQGGCHDRAGSPLGGTRAGGVVAGLAARGERQQTRAARRCTGRREGRERDAAGQQPPLPADQQRHAGERERWLGGAAARRSRAVMGLLEGGDERHRGAQCGARLRPSRCAQGARRVVRCGRG